VVPGKARRACPIKNGFEESFQLKRTLLLPFFAAISAVLMPLAAAGQVAPTKRPASVDRDEPSYKYEAFVGYGYTSLNQLNQSRSGLQGVNVSLTRDWGKYFGITADGAYYKYALKTGNPGDPSVDLLMFGPVIHAALYGKTNGFIHVLLGGEHTGGESMTPDISLAGGFGGGLEYSLGPRLSIRASGDDIASSFSLAGNSPKLGLSPHMNWNARATFGVVYKF
jgi:hypothetical protein